MLYMFTPEDVLRTEARLSLIGGFSVKCPKQYKLTASLSPFYPEIPIRTKC
jgi:hypothetical protein